MSVQPETVSTEAAKAAYEPPSLVEYGQASSLIQTNPSGTANDGGVSPDDYAS